MELRGQDQNDVIRSSSPSNYGLVERRNREGGNNHNGTTPPTPTNPTPTILAYTQALDLHPHQPHRLPGGSHTKRPIDRYRECLRNHAASIGGNVYDGCGEFMAGGEEGTLEALKCAACDCHRNFHRKETEGDTPTALTHFSSRRRNVVTSTTNTVTPTLFHSLQLPVPYHHHHPQSYPPVVQPMSVAFGGGSGGGTESSSEELNVYRSNRNVEGGGGAVPPPPPPPYMLSKKRFRTKFTPEQKEKMMEFAEKIGWRINRQDEGEVERFCEEVGIRRQVFKVWMHNNKNLKKGAPSQEEHPGNQCENPK